MVFNSYSFAIFFAVVLALYYLPMGWSARKWVLVAASGVFYAAWNPPFLLLLMVSAVVDYGLARWMGRLTNGAARRALLIVSLTLNLGMLGYFKYGGFLLDNFVLLMAAAGITYHPPDLGIILPLGISFYTFETISYLVDVYRRKITPWNSFLDYVLFLTFFPHLVAGPIVRADDFLPQCREPKRASSAQMGWGLTLLVVGLFEKIVLADGLVGPVADRVYDAVGPVGVRDAWLGTLAFTCQIFFDFAGYSTCAIGVALCLGFALKDNFHFPYAAAGFSDFWRRWHISLSTWLRDYLYIPLGGNRLGEARTYLNLMITMLLGGLWHGASWRFVAWGALHGVYLAVERAVRGRRPPGDPAGPIRLAASILGTFLLVCVTWVFFRAQNFSSAYHLVGSLFGVMRGSAGLPLIRSVEGLSVLAVTAALLVGHWAFRDSSLEAAAARTPWPLRSLILAGMIVLIFLSPGEDRAFIYFQF
jgi:alginate O-acetyltransferase complex protein AlgI